MCIILFNNTTAFDQPTLPEKKSDHLPNFTTKIKATNNREIEIDNKAVHVYQLLFTGCPVFI